MTKNLITCLIIPARSETVSSFIVGFNFTFHNGRHGNVSCYHLRNPHFMPTKKGFSPWLHKITLMGFVKSGSQTPPQTLTPVRESPDLSANLTYVPGGGWTQISVFRAIVCPGRITAFSELKMSYPAAKELPLIGKLAFSLIFWIVKIPPSEKFILLWFKTRARTLQVLFKTSFFPPFASIMEIRFFCW